MTRSVAALGWILSIGLFGAVGVGADNAECIVGPSNAPVKIEVFSDYQCPSCRTFYLETIRPVIDAYGGTGKICVVYYEFPLQQHAYAREAARYAIAARRLGKTQYLHVSDALYSEQALWSADGKVEAAVARALSPDEFARLKKVLDGPGVGQEIDRDIMVGNGRGVASTPTFFVSARGREQKVVGGVSLAILKNFIEQNTR
jgi:protein-disulfide isomerase